MLRLCCDEETVMSGSGETRERRLLTKVTIEALKPGERPYRVPDVRAAGLALRVAPSGSKTFDVAYRVTRSSRVKRVALGRYGDLSLEEARDSRGRPDSRSASGRRSRRARARGGRGQS